MNSLVVNFGIIFICMGLGVILRKSGRCPETTPKVLGSLIIHVCLPALTLKTLHSLDTDSAHAGFAISAAWFLFVLGFGFFEWMGRIFQFSPSTRGALTLSCALANTSFVGFPLLIALFGTHALGIGVLVDQPGTFLVLSTLGVIASAYYSANKISFTALALRIVKFPPFHALILSLLLRGVTFPLALDEWLERLSSPLIPLALISVGFQLRVNWNTLKRYRLPLAAGLIYKLILGPAIIASVFVFVLGGHGEPLQITLAEVAMPPMITGAILAEDAGLEPRLAHLLVGLGIPLSLLTVPVWVYMLRGI